MIEDKDIGLIEDYLRGQLSDEEKLTLEERLRTDEELRNTLQQHQWILDGFAGLRLQRLQEYVSGLQTGPQSGSLIVWRRIWPFAVLALIALLLYFLLDIYDSTTDSPTFQALANQYYDSPAGLTARSGTTGFSQPMQSAMTAYEDGQWEVAIENFRLATEPAELPTARYFLAHSLYQTERFEESIQMFMRCREDDQYRQQAEWHLALAQLQAGDVNAARDLLSAIAGDTSHFYSSNSKTLLGKIPER